MRKQKRIRFAVAVLALAALIAVASGAWIAAETSGLRGDGARLRGGGQAEAFRVETFTLDNGMQVMTLPMPGLAKVTYMVWYKVGAADDPPGKSGLAHFVEHATFRGLGADAEHVHAQAAMHNGPETDAFTSYDYTAYYHVVSGDRLEAVMKTEADRMRNVVITEEALGPERDKIRAERCVEITNVPEARFDEHMRAALYGKQPNGAPVLGWPEEQQRLTAQDVSAFYQTWYAPNNAVLIVAGDITAARLALLVQRYYGGIPARPVPARHRPSAPDLSGGQPLVMQDPLMREPVWKRMYLAPSYHAGDTKHGYALQVLGKTLAGEPTGRLYRRLVVEKRLATAIDVEYLPDTLGLTDFTVRAIPAPGVELTALDQAIKRELETMVAKGVSRAEVARAQQRLQRQVPWSREHGHAVAETLGMALTTGRTLAEVGQWRERIATVTQEQVHEAARAVLRVERSVTGLLLPVSASDAARAQGLQSEQRGRAERVHATCEEREHASRRTGRGGSFYP